MPKKLYTYLVTMDVKMQFTFNEDEVEQAEEGGPVDIDPTQRALDALGKEIKDCLSNNYAVQSVEAWADFDELLGETEDE